MAETPVHIVFIDDDQDDIFLIKDLLNEIHGTQYKVEWTPEFDAAINAIQRQEADVYLIDYQLGSRTGLEILEAVKGFDLTKPMILLTGLGDHEVDMEAMRKGASDFLKKEQITADLLERAIRYAIKRSQDQEKIKEVERFKAEKIAAEIATQAKSRFLANMSHEIRTPLGSILGFADLANDSSLTESKRADFISIIKRSGEHLLELINDILDLSKIEAGHLKLDFSDYPWQSIFKEVIELLRPKAAAKGIELNFHIKGEIPNLLRTDLNRLRQILMNVVGNAIKFTEKGSVTVECKLESIRAHRQLKISVIDTGIGMSGSDQARIFQPFQQGNSGTNRKYGGTGLGLDLSRKLAQALGGDLILSASKLQRGSTFEILLPAHFRKSAQNQSKTSYTTQPIHSKLSVLLVEDAVENQLLVKYLLEKVGFTIVTAGNGREGVRKALSGNYDVVLMDIQMPDMDGYEATRILRAQGYKTPIVALTAHAMNEECQRAMSMGFSDYLTKPIVRDRLIETLNKFSPDSFHECPIVRKGYEDSLRGEYRAEI